MASLGVLASLMQGLTPQMPNYDPLEVQKQRTSNQTNLITLAEMKQKQAAEAEFMRAVQTDPVLQQQFFGGGAGPVLGSLQTAPGGAGVGPMTQQQVMPGQPPGAPQVVPGGQDLSQFATQGAPGSQNPRQLAPDGGPQSILGSLGPQPQGPMQAPRNPVLEMAQRDPRAAFLMQQQLQAQQALQWKNEERRLDMGVKVAAGVAQELNAVKDQETLDAARERIRLYHPQAAAQIPQFYSKEALEPLIMKGVAVEKLAEWRKDMATAKQTEMMTERLPQVFGALQQFATGAGGTQAPPSGTTTTGAAPPTTARQQAVPAAFEAAIADATRLFPQVKPERIKSIIAAESNFDPKAVSSAGAKGPMQLMDATAKDMGVDDPFDITQNVRGGTRYYAQLLTKYGGDERKALAAYNWGPANLDKVGGDVSKAPAETQAYVQKVLGGGGGTGGTGTAQAPQADPKIAQLDTQIKQGQALALQLSAVPGMQAAASMVNQQVNDLQKQRDYLDAPQQEYRKKLAVQGLELEQKEREGLARAQLEADTKPATTAEIDAINRGLPPDKQLPYGTTHKEIREKRLIGREPAGDKVVDDLTKTTIAIQQFEELSNAVTALPTGPLTQYIETFKERWGIDISDEKVAQRAILAGAQNQLLQARNGAAIAPHEYDRLMKELPNEALDPKVFKARLANTVRQFKNAYKTKVQILRKTGHAIPDDLMEPLPAPEAPPAPKVSSNVDKFKGIKP